MDKLRMSLQNLSCLLLVKIRGRFIGRFGCSATHESAAFNISRYALWGVLDECLCSCSRGLGRIRPCQRQTVKQETDCGLAQ